MDSNVNEPDSRESLPSPWATPAGDSDDSAAPALTGGTRSDGWTGERMAKFCEALADTGLVVDACLAAGKSTDTAYATRRRNPMFAAAWEAALIIARERLADTLLARSIEGTLEQYYKDGVLVGEKRAIDNRLGLAILRRLDRLADSGTPLSTRGERRTINPACPGRSRAEPGRAMDWDLPLSAMRSNDPEAVAEALAMLRGEPPEAHEAHDPPNPLIEQGEDGEDDAPDDGTGRCWLEDEQDDKMWMTNFPPPDGFTGYEQGQWGDAGYQRECSPAERALLDRGDANDLAYYRSGDAALRDSWFARVEAQLAAQSGGNPVADPGP